MKSYKDIHFSINEPIEIVLAKITASLTDGWERDEDSDRQSRAMSSGDDYASHYFYCDKRNDRWAATVILTRKGPQKYWLSHVLPQKDSPNPFEPDQFNAIADEFCERFLRPLEEQGTIFVLNFEGDIDLSVELGAELFQKLRTFSAAANKSTGSSHPLDRDRWFEFIVSLCRTDVELSAPTLKRWLVEEGKWSEEDAHELAKEFEFGVGLLRYEKRG